MQKASDDGSMPFFFVFCQIDDRMRIDDNMRGIYSKYMGANELAQRGERCEG